MPSELETSILQLLFNGERFGREIRDEYQRATDRKLPLGSLYTTLHRMEAKGYVKSRFGESTHERGGNRRKYYKMTFDGNNVLNDVAQRWSLLGGLGNG